MEGSYCDAQLIQGTLEGYKGVVNWLISLEEIVPLLLLGFSIGFLLCPEGLNVLAVNVSQFGIDGGK